MEEHSTSWFLVNLERLSLTVLRFSFYHIDGLKHICLKGIRVLQIINYSVTLMLTVSVRYGEDAHV